MHKDIELHTIYQQEPIDIKRRLYSSLKDYDSELTKFKAIKKYIDSAGLEKIIIAALYMVRPMRMKLISWM